MRMKVKRRRLRVARKLARVPCYSVYAVSVAKWHRSDGCGSLTIARSHELFKAKPSQARYYGMMSRVNLVKLWTWPGAGEDGHAKGKRRARRVVPVEGQEQSVSSLMQI